MSPQQAMRLLGLRTYCRRTGAPYWRDAVALAFSMSDYLHPSEVDLVGDLRAVLAGLPPPDTRTTAMRRDARRIFARVRASVWDGVCQAVKKVGM